MTTEVDNKQNPVAAAVSEEAAAAVVTKEEVKEVAAAVKSADGAGGDAAAAEAAAKAEDGSAGKAAEDGAEKKDTAAVADAEAAAKAEPPVKYNVHRQNFEKDIVYLYQFSRTPVLPSLSPYCLKVETWLRLAGLKYENVDHKTKFRSKKGLLPFIELNGEEVADSAIIIKELSQKFEQDIDAGLTLEQKNIAHATISMIENHLVWVLVWWRSKHPDQVLKGYKVNLQHALGTRIPNSILNFFFKFSFGRKGAKKVKAQGLGVHKPEEIEEFGKNDLKVLSDMLADKPFYFGDEPTLLDVVSFSVLSQLHFISADVPLPLRDYMSSSCPNLVGHVSRMKERCFPDWDEICTKLDLNAHLPKPAPEAKEGKEADTEKKTEQENGDTDKPEKELEKDKAEEKKEKIEENKEKEEAK